MDNDQLDNLLRIVLTRRDVLAILEALAEPYAGELTAVNIYASKVQQRLSRKWAAELGQEPTDAVSSS